MLEQEMDNQGSCPSCGSPSHTGSHTSDCPANKQNDEQTDDTRIKNSETVTIADVLDSKYEKFHTSGQLIEAMKSANHEEEKEYIKEMLNNRLESNRKQAEQLEIDLANQDPTGYLQGNYGYGNLSSWLTDVRKDIYLIETELAKEKFDDFSARVEQITTRGDGTLEKSEEFSRENIDFGASLEHLKIHHNGEVAGSQFNSELFKDPQEVEILLKKLLPDRLQYDQYGRAELTLEISHDNDESIGWTGVKSIEEIQKMFPSAKFEKRQRNSGGVEAVEDSVNGAWYPEVIRDPETGKFIIALDAEGNVKNPKGKFEPDANIASVSDSEFKEAAKTDKISVIIQKDGKTNKPVVLTIYPGENAPMYPAKINSETYKADTTGVSKETKFWNGHAFIKAE